MRRLVVAAASLALVIAVTGTTRSVERERYVAANMELVAELPTYPGARVLEVYVDHAGA